MIEVSGVKEEDLYGKVALVSSDPGCTGQTFKMNVETDDCNSYYYWIEIWKGGHYSYDYFKNEDYSELLKYSAVILQATGICSSDFVKIATQLKGKVVIMLWPEHVLGCDGINQFHIEEYEAWKAADVIMNWEENTGSCYTSISGTPSHFVYVPIREAMSSGEFFVPLEGKDDSILVYGDNNPTNPVIAMAVAKQLGKSVVTVEINEEKRNGIVQLLGVNIKGYYAKQSTYVYLRLLGKSRIHIYPNSRVGTNREQVSCACVGTPCIGNMMSHTQRRLFPKLAVDHRDVSTMVEMATKLYNEPDFYRDVVNYAREQLLFYNLENTKRRFMEAYVIGKNHAGI